MTKSDIRRMMRARRKALSPDLRAAAAARVAQELPSRCPEGAVIAVYFASPEEIDLGPFIEKMLACGRTVAAPRWNGVGYTLARVRGISQGDLRRGPMAILEPAQDDPVLPGDVGVWIVPGLAFTRGGKRLGYGGGWYDRMMVGSAEGASRIGVAYDFQVVGDLPAEPHDVPLTEIFECSGL